MTSPPSKDLAETQKESDSIARSPLFTIVIPTRDRPTELARCVTALRNLELPSGEVEVVLVDDGSEPPVQVDFGELDGVVLRRNGDGPARARNAGAREARGRFLAFLDDDCEPDSMWLKVLEKEMAGRSGVCLGGAVHNALIKNHCSSASQLLVDYLYEVFDSTSEHFFCSNNLCVSRAEFVALGGFDESFPLPAAEDRDFCIRWQEAGYELRFVPEAIMAHSHPMGLRGFWRQHYRYGRGAYQFHLLRSKRAGAPLKIEPFRFYWNLIRFPFRRLRFIPASTTCSLLLVSQLANALGFFRERSMQTSAPSTSRRA